MNRGSRRRLMMIFVDGWGIGVSDPSRNPFLGARMPWLRGLLGGPMDECVLSAGGRPLIAPRGFASAIDTLLGYPGLPQSATGQASLLTGFNAVQAAGGHRSAYPAGAVAELIARHSIFKQIAALGLESTFINAYRSPTYSSLDPQRLSATTLAIMAAGLPLRTLADLGRGEAVYHDLTGFLLREQGWNVSPVDPWTAGKRAAAVARQHHFSLFEHFLTDLVGHSQDMGRAVAVLESLDTFLGAVAGAAGPDLTILITSDHGNIEDLGCGTHTANPVPILVLGDHEGLLAAAVRPFRDLTDVTPAIVSFLRENSSGGGG